MNSRALFVVIVVVVVGAVALFGYVYWIRFQHWYEICYPNKRLCFHGRYLNWSTLEFDRVFWSPANQSLAGCPLILLVGGESYKIADLTSPEMSKLGVELMPTSNPGASWIKHPSSENAYKLVFGFDDGGQIVSFSIQRSAGRMSSGQETFQVMVGDRELSLPIVEKSLIEMLGPPEVRRRQLMWP